MTKFLFYDTETTGLLKPCNSRLDWQPYIIEFYGVIYDEDQNKLDELEFLCKPPVPITEKITKITGLIFEDVVDKPNFAHYAEDVKMLFDSVDVQIAHNLSYDSNVIECEFSRLLKSVTHPKKFCTLEQTRWMEGKKLSLGDLYMKCFGEKMKKAHRAREDVSAMVRVFFHLKGVIW